MLIWRPDLKNRHKRLQCEESSPSLCDNITGLFFLQVKNLVVVLLIWLDVVIQLNVNILKYFVMEIFTVKIVLMKELFVVKLFVWFCFINIRYLKLII